MDSTDGLISPAGRISAYWEKRSLTGLGQVLLVLKGASIRSLTKTGMPLIYETNMKALSHQIAFPFAKENSNQVALFPEKMGHDYGTFKDCLRSPIHNWFTYPAGYSYKLIWEAGKIYHLNSRHKIYDPFAGTGTTLVAAKQIGISSIGIEAHPFVYWVAKTKLFWEFNLSFLCNRAYKFISLLKQNPIRKPKEKELSIIFPDLVLRCYTPETLLNLYIIRETIKSELQNVHYRDFFNLALTKTLREVAAVQTGWPYIAPQKPKKGNEKNVIEVFGNILLKMVGDLQIVRSQNGKNGKPEIHNKDARSVREFVADESVDAIITSPPYLNNYDYADRTRLETYFFEKCKSWSDITMKVRNRLIMAATTQVVRKSAGVPPALDNSIHDVAPQLFRELTEKINLLSSQRLIHGGKKSYDYMVAGYFNDMFLVMKECYRVLQKGAPFLLVLGDSAPYGIHIPTEHYLGEMGVALGFSGYTTEQLRTRGDKWRNNPQRHSVKLKESILTLIK